MLQMTEENREEQRFTPGPLNSKSAQDCGQRSEIESKFKQTHSACCMYNNSLLKTYLDSDSDCEQQKKEEEKPPRKMLCNMSKKNMIKLVELIFSGMPISLCAAHCAEFNGEYCCHN